MSTAIETPQAPLNLKIVLIDTKTGAVLGKPGRKTAALAASARQLKRQIGQLQEALDQTHAEIAKTLPAGRSLVFEDGYRLQRIESSTWKVTDPDALEHILGPRFHDLVEITVRYRLTPKLKAMASDGDDELGKAVRGCLEVESRTQLKHLPASG